MKITLSVTKADIGSMGGLIALSANSRIALPALFEVCRRAVICNMHTAYVCRSHCERSEAIQRID
jgi:hypothetical protein